MKIDVNTNLNIAQKNVEQRIAREAFKLEHAGANQAAEGFCPKCGERVFLTALHGDKGGPKMCWKCGGAWHAKHARRRKAGRVVIKALKVFFDAGGDFLHVNALRLAASGMSVSAEYGDTIGVEVGDITTELLDETLQLVHPDKHPTERKEAAMRVTQELSLEGWAATRRAPAPCWDACGLW